ncbi:MAG TPA: hypothetical protein VN958_13685 [Chitinophagaceae bacterium]|nr:hypothetical protein [Chitinophagaceae bacterium]
MLRIEKILYKNWNFLSAPCLAIVGLVINNIVYPALDPLLVTTPTKRKEEKIILYYADVANGVFKPMAKSMF